MHFITYVASLVLVFLTAAHAQNQPSKNAELVRESGKPFRIKLKSGGLLRLEINDQIAGRTIQIPFKIIENECSKAPVQNCTYHLTSKPVFFRWVWDENPEKPELKGTLYDLEEEDDTKFIGILSGDEFASGIKFGVPRDRLVCPTFEFLPTGTKQAPEKLMIPMWSGQFMFQNLDTMVNENQPFSGGINISLVRAKDNAQALEFAGVESYISEFPFLFSLSGPSTIIFNKNNAKNPQTCELIAETDASGIGSDFVPETPKGEFRNYIVGKDKYLSMGGSSSELLSSIQSIFEKADSEAYEKERMAQQQEKKDEEQKMEDLK